MLHLASVGEYSGKCSWLSRRRQRVWFSVGEPHVMGVNGWPTPSQDSILFIILGKENLAATEVVVNEDHRIHGYYKNTMLKLILWSLVLEPQGWKLAPCIHRKGLFLHHLCSHSHINQTSLQPFSYQKKTFNETFCVCIHKDATPDNTVQGKLTMWMWKINLGYIEISSMMIWCHIIWLKSWVIPWSVAEHFWKFMGW